MNCVTCFNFIIIYYIVDFIIIKKNKIQIFSSFTHVLICKKKIFTGLMQKMVIKNYFNVNLIRKCS